MTWRFTWTASSSVYEISPVEANNASETPFRTPVDIVRFTGLITPTLGEELDTKAGASLDLGSRWAIHDYAGEILPSGFPVEFPSFISV